MELRELVKILKKNMFLLLGVGFLFAFVGCGLYFLPTKYIASGSFFVTRRIDDSSEEFFTYEGYYAQQNSLIFAQTVIGLFENIDVKKETLQKSGLDVNETTLRKLGRSVRIVRESPQLITVEVKDVTKENAKYLWENLSSSVLEKSVKITQQGDDKLKVVRVNSDPEVRESYKNVVIFSIVGFGFGLTIGVLVVLIKRYFK